MNNQNNSQLVTQQPIDWSNDAGMQTIQSGLSGLSGSGKGWTSDPSATGHQASFKNFTDFLGLGGARNYHFIGGLGDASNRSNTAGQGWVKTEAPYFQTLANITGSDWTRGGQTYSAGGDSPFGGGTQFLASIVDDPTILEGLKGRGAGYETLRSELANLGGTFDLVRNSLIQHAEASGDAGGNIINDWLLQKAPGTDMTNEQLLGVLQEQSAAAEGSLGLLSQQQGTLDTLAQPQNYAEDEQTREMIDNVREFDADLANELGGKLNSLNAARARGELSDLQYRKELKAAKNNILSNQDRLKMDLTRISNETDKRFNNLVDSILGGRRKEAETTEIRRVFDESQAGLDSFLNTSGMGQTSAAPSLREEGFRNLRRSLVQAAAGRERDAQTVQQQAIAARAESMRNAVSQAASRDVLAQNIDLLLAQNTGRDRMSNQEIMDRQFAIHDAARVNPE
jgi:hypothetical protein